jgi:hypothetical protein
MRNDPVERLWLYTYELVSAERRRGGELYSKMQFIVRLDRSFQIQDLVPEFISVVLDKSSDDKDYVALRSEIRWDTSDFYFRQKTSFAFRTFIKRRLQLLRNRKSIEVLPEPENPPTTIEDKIMNKQIQLTLTDAEAAVVAWRLKEISLEEALRRTGYKTKPSLYSMLKNIRSKVYRSE